MYLFNTEGFGIRNVLRLAIVDFYRGVGGPVMDNTQKAQAAHENRNFGYREGIAQGMGHMLTLERATTFYLFKRTEQVNGFDVSKVLRDWKDRFEERPDDKTVDEIVEAVYALIGTDTQGRDLAEAHETIRRQAIVRGEIKPTEADRAWIEAKAAEKRAEIDEIVGLLIPIDQARDNDPKRGA